MTRRLRFGLDVDGVMYQFQKTALYMLNSMKGYTLKLEDWTYWNQPKDVVSNNDWQWLWSGGVKYGLFRYGHLYKGTIEAVRTLSELGSVVVITHRPHHAVQDTLDWLAYLRLPFAETYILSEGEAKSQVKCDLYVDDKPENSLDYGEHTRGLSLLWKRPWNTSWVADFDEASLRLYNIKTVDSWEEVIGHAREVVHDQG